MTPTEALSRLVVLAGLASPDDRNPELTLMAIGTLKLVIKRDADVQKLLAEARAAAVQGIEEGLKV